MSYQQIPEVPIWERIYLDDQLQQTKKFFEGVDKISHMHQRWRQQLLRYQFTIVHRPARFMIECDTLSRCNVLTAKWRVKDAEEDTKVLTASQMPGAERSNTIASANEP
jgi:hypothetical protein